jgi:hypothetical protein
MSSLSFGDPRSAREHRTSRSSMGTDAITPSSMHLSTQSMMKVEVATEPPRIGRNVLLPVNIQRGGQRLEGTSVLKRHFRKRVLQSFYLSS